MDIRKYIDNSLLKPDITEKQLVEFAEKSAQIGFFSICVPPFYVRKAREVIGSRIRLCSVVGFPLGYQKKETKIFEVQQVIEDGCDEVDTVLNISALVYGNYRYIEEEVKAITRHARFAGVVTKFIIETFYLNNAQKVRAVEILLEAGADFVKTSTGFAEGGATEDDVRLLKEAGRGKLRVKASGGIKDLKSALSMIEAGADRIGTSKGFDIYRESLKG